MHTQLNVCEKEELPCFLYLIQIFGVDPKKEANSLQICPSLVTHNVIIGKEVHQ